MQLHRFSVSVTRIASVTWTLTLFLYQTPGSDALLVPIPDGSSGLVEMHHQAGACPLDARIRSRFLRTFSA